MRTLLLLVSLLVPSASATPSDAPSARELLAAWDAQRSAAWADGDVRRLRSLYTDGSVAGERDVAMLQRWVDRDLAVTGMRMQVFSVRELSQTDERLAIVVVDRVAGAEVGGVPLPRDAPTEHRVVLRLVAGEWLVAAVS